MFKKRPRAVKGFTAAKRADESSSKMEPRYWQERLFKNTFTYKGQRMEVSGWSVKIQLFGKRKTFSLNSRDRNEAAAEACHIYQTIMTQGWDAVAHGRSRLGLQRYEASGGLLPNPSIEPDTDDWKRRLIHRKYPEKSNLNDEQGLSVRIEHARTSHYFPLGTNNETEAADKAIQIYQAVTSQGWAVANQKFSRELTLALRWLDDPLAWTYTTIHTWKNGDPLSIPNGSHGSTEFAVAVIEPDAGIRFALAACVNNQKKFRCDATFASATEALREITRLSVNFILANYSLPDQSGAACIEQLQHLKPNVTGLLYSVFEDSDQLFKSTPGGAAGYMLKRSPSFRIFEPVAEAPGPLTREQIASRIREYFQRLVAALPSGESAVHMAKLTPREHQILALLSKGDLAKEIADTLGISIWTVHGHVKNIFEKLNVHTRTEAVVKFLQK